MKRLLAASELSFLFCLATISSSITIAALFALCLPDFRSFIFSRVLNNNDVDFVSQVLAIGLVMEEKASDQTLPRSVVNGRGSK